MLVNITYEIRIQFTNIHYKFQSNDLHIGQKHLVALPSNDDLVASNDLNVITFIKPHNTSRITNIVSLRGLT